MKKSVFKRGLAAAAITVAALVAVPAAAMAVDTYPPTEPVVVVPPQLTLRPGETNTISLSGLGPFSLTVLNWSGFGSGTTLATFATQTRQTSISKAADENGALSFTFTMPTDARGLHTISATAENFSRTWVIDSGVPLPGDAAPAGAGSENALSETGSGNDQLLALWIAGGGLALVGSGVVVASSVRKQRRLQL